MRIYNYILMTTVALAAFSCTNDLINSVSLDNSNQINCIQSSLAADSRFNDVENSWDENDAIGVFMFDGSAKEIINEAVNIKYTATESGATVKFSTLTPIKIHSENVDFVSYYPYDSDINDFVYSKELSDQSKGYEAFDLLYAKNTDVNNEAAKSLSFNFSHQLSKVIIKPKLGDGCVLKGVTIKGMPVSYQFDLYSGEFSSGETGDIIPYYNEAESSYTALVTPVSNAALMSILFEVEDDKGNAKEYTYVVNPEKISSFDKGKSYTINLDIQTIVVPDPEEPEDPVEGFDHVIEATSDMDIVGSLQDLSGKCAIKFNSEQPIVLTQQLVIPEQVTELTFICPDEKQAEVTLKDIMIHPALSLLAFDNLILKGDRSLPLIETSQEMANMGVIKFTNCHVSQMKATYYCDETVIQENVLSDYIIDNCIFTDMDVVLHYRASASVTFKKSTFYDIKSRIYNFQFENTQLSSTRLVLTIEDCTYVLMGSHCIAGNDSAADLYFHRNIAIATAGKSIVYRINVFSASDNYVPEGYGKYLHGREYPEAITEIPLGTLLPKWSEINPDFTTSYPAGDPRWRIDK